MKVTSISSNLSWRLDMARALAALLVMLGHLRNDTFVAYGDLLHNYQNAINFFLFFVTRLGHEAVMVFFVLSGFLVGGNALKEWKDGSFEYFDYFSKRLMRMYVVLIPALIIGGGMDLILSHLTSEPIANFTASTFLGNLFFLQTIFVSTWGSNAPLWSLANEFWYYILWPVILILFSRKTNVVGMIMYSCILIFMYYVSPDIIRLFPLWVLGALLRQIPPRESLKTWFIIPAMFLFIIAASYSCWAKNIFGEYATGITFGVILLCWTSIQFPERMIIPVFWKWLAAFSFSLYAIHYPLMKLLLQIINHRVRSTNAGINNWMVLLCVACLLLFMSWIYYIMFEKHTNRIRKNLMSLIGMRWGIADK